MFYYTKRQLYFIVYHFIQRYIVWATESVVK
jgi:hypothetical protein